MEVVTGPGAPSLGVFLHLVDMSAVPLISSIITLGTGITMMMFRQAGLSLLIQAGKLGREIATNHVLSLSRYEEIAEIGFGN